MEDRAPQIVQYPYETVLNIISNTIENHKRNPMSINFFIRSPKLNNDESTTTYFTFPIYPQMLIIG